MTAFHGAIPICERLQILVSARHMAGIQPLFVGTIHAVMLSWEAYTDLEGSEVLSTDPSRASFARNTHWGQALQVMEDVNAHGQVSHPARIPCAAHPGGVRYCMSRNVCGLPSLCFIHTSCLCIGMDF